MTIEGTLDEFRLPEILQMVGQQQKTGILTVQGDATIVAVSFLAGRIVAADSLEETVEERLGSVLVREGLLTRQDFGRVVDRQRQGQGRLIDLLVEGGHLDREQVLESLRLQTSELLADLLTWESGDFKFYANDEVAYEEGFRPLPVDDLLLSLLPHEEAEAAEEPAAESFAAEGFTAESFAAQPAGTVGEAAADEATGAAEDVEAAPDAAMAEVVPLPVTRWDGDATMSEPVFVPPEAVARPAAAGRVRGTDPILWLPTVFAALLSLALVAVLFADPGHFLLPLPWQGRERDSLRSVQRQAEYQGIDAAAKTFFLLEGRFPDGLELLVDLSILDPADLRDPSGARLQLTAREDSYELRPAPGADGAGEPERVNVEAITGNFLLDPEYLTAAPTDAVPPLVLVD